MYIYEGNGPVASVPSQMRRCNTRSEGEKKAIQELVDKIKGQHGVDVTLSAQAEYRSHEMAVGIVVTGRGMLRPRLDDVLYV